MTQIDSPETLREALTELLEKANENDIPRKTVVGLLTAYLAQLRGDVRLPLGMDPERAAQFRETAGDNINETIEVELRITQDVIDELDLQLRAIDPEDE